MPSSQQLAELIAEADQRRKKGQAVLAQRLYVHVLDLAPSHPPALYGLGALAAEAGCMDQAESLLAAAVALVPGHPGYQTLYGATLQLLGKTEQALSAFQAAQRLVPDAMQPVAGMVQCLIRAQRFSEVGAVIAQAQAHGVDGAPLWASLGQVLKSAQQWDAAEDAFSQAIAANPAEALGWQGRASLRLSRRQIAQALMDGQKAVELAPERADVWVLLAAILRATDDLPAALAACKRALEIAPAHVDGLAQFGTLLNQTGQDSAALEALQRAYQAAPDRLDIVYNLAGCLIGAEQYAQAEPLYQQCVEQKPLWRDAWTNLGVSRLRQGALETAEHALQQAVMMPETEGISETAGLPEARYNLAWVQLLRGNFRDGWRSYEARWTLPNFSSPRCPFPVPLWDGAVNPTLHLFLHAEQGLGDTIQMLHLLPLVQARVGRVTIEVQSPLVRLVQALPGLDRVVVRHSGQDPAVLPVACDAHAPLMSVPFLLGLDLGDLPVSPRPYLTAPPAHGALDLGKASRPRVGVVWAGSPDNKIDRYRTIPWPTFAPLAASADVEVWSLQLGVQPPQGLRGCMEHVQDMADTASLLMQMDLVIGVDTSVLHLAAALGRPSWMLIPFAPDYRWLEAGERSSWYPSLRLFRQPKTGDWESVVAQVLEEQADWLIKQLEL